MENLGPKIKRLRNNRKWTQEEFAEILGYSDRQIRRLEAHGSNSLLVLENIADVFNISLEDLLFNEHIR